MKKPGGEQNAGKGEVFYGMHFYPGVARYENPGQDPYTVFLNEDTIREMDPTFKGRPVYVMHVDEVEQNLDQLRSEVDGWVTKSFYNEADGKHWVEFIVVSEKGLRAIKSGMRLSNCYVPKSFASGGLWNGVSYAKEITGGEYEHLAIVPNPRYEESVIMTPEEFKKYNEDKQVELKRLSNRKDEGMMKFFKKTKVENATDISEMSVVLPKSGIEVSIAKMINDMDNAAMRNDPPSIDPGGAAGMKKAFGNEGLADPSHKVKLHDGSYCNVEELVAKHKAMHDELEDMKKKKEDGEDQDKEYEEKGDEVDMESKDKMNREGKDMPEGKTPSSVTTNEEEIVKGDEKEVKEAKSKNAKEKADKLRNAHVTPVEAPIVYLSADRVERGKVRYGSSK